MPKKKNLIPEKLRRNKQINLKSDELKINRIKELVEVAQDTNQYRTKTDVVLESLERAWGDR